jgi:antitoxin PrlF
MAIRYSGTVTTSGNSEAIRLEKSLFRAHPEFQRSSRVTASVIAPGQMLVSVADESAGGDDDDPVLDAFVAFLAHDIESHPERLERLSAGSIARAVELTEGIDVGDDQVFPTDATI